MKIFSTLLLATAMASGANATLISGGSFSNGLETTDIAQVGTLQKFDSNLGTLNSVLLTLTGQITSQITLINTGDRSFIARGTTNVDLNFSSTNSLLAGFIPVPALSMSVTTGSQSIAAHSSVTFGPFADSETFVLNLSAAPLLASLSMSGGGTFDVDCVSDAGFGATGGGGNISTAQVTMAGCGATLVYDYTARTTTVPEPGALALVGLALAGLSLSRRFSKKA